MKKYFLVTRIFAITTILVAWGLSDSPLLGVVLILFLIGLSALRFHFKPHILCTVTETAVCIIYAFFWLPALLGLWFTVIAFLENRWRIRETEILESEYNDRTELLKLRKSQESSEQQMRKVAHLTELSERARIAQDIHDHVGHEISGTLIALRTALVLHEKSDERAGDLLNQAIKRLESASENLRETVHNLKPARVSGTDALRELCDGFTFCEISFTANGNNTDVNANDILTANLKEALTNISRHSNATKVEVKLDSNDSFIRLMVHDNGTTVSENKSGMGLAGMRERVREAGGTLTVNTENGFKVVCIIPKKQKRSDAL